MARWQYQALAEPASTSPESVTVDRWQPVYPDRLVRPALLAAIIAGSCFYCDIPRKEATTVDRWQASYPDRIDAPKRQQHTFPFAAALDPFPRPTAEVITLDKWYAEPQKPRWDTPRRQYLYPDSALVLTVPEAITPDKWLPSYPERLNPARRPFWEGQSVTDPRALTLPEATSLDKWQPVYPDRLIPKARPQPYDWTVSTLFVGPPEVVTCDKWLPTYPVRLDPARRVFWEGIVSSDWLAHVPPPPVNGPLFLALLGVGS